MLSSTKWENWVEAFLRENETSNHPKLEVWLYFPSAREAGSAPATATSENRKKCKNSTETLTAGLFLSASWGLL